MDLACRHANVLAGVEALSQSRGQGVVGVPLARTKIAASLHPTCID